METQFLHSLSFSKPLRSKKEGGHLLYASVSTGIQTLYASSWGLAMFIVHTYANSYTLVRVYTYTDK